MRVTLLAFGILRDQFPATSPLDLLSYYFNVERVAFAAKADHCEQFKSDWDRLEAILKELTTA